MNKLDEIEKYFNTNGILEGEVKIDRTTTIVNPVLFVESSIATLKRNSGKKVYRPYFDSLLKYYNIVKNR
jgi:uncharacterized protein DUF6965